MSEDPYWFMWQNSNSRSRSVCARSMLMNARVYGNGPRCQLMKPMKIPLSTVCAGVAKKAKIKDTGRRKRIATYLSGVFRTYRTCLLIWSDWIYLSVLYSSALHGTGYDMPSTLNVPCVVCSAIPSYVASLWTPCTNVRMVVLWTHRFALFDLGLQWA